MESDPIGMKSGVNTFAYVAQNPVQFLEPAGLMGRKGPGVNSGQTSSFGFFGCVGGCVSSAGGKGPQASLEATLGGGFEICEDKPASKPCEAPPKKPKYSCGMYDPNCDDTVQPPDIPVPTRRVGLGYVVGIAIKRDGRICLRFGLFGTIPFIPSIELGDLEEH